MSGLSLSLESSEGTIHIVARDFNPLKCGISTKIGDFVCGPWTSLRMTKNDTIC